MVKKILVVLVALWVIGSLFGEDEPQDTVAEAGDGLMAEAGDGLMAEAGAEEVTPTAMPSPNRAPATTPAHPKDAAPDREGTAKREARPGKRAATYLVTRVIDGDTIELGNGESVRVVGIDSPERGECGYPEATATMERLVLGKRVRLTMSDEDRDRYDRLLRYVDVGALDAGLRLIDRGLAVARYDSRDGYGYHPRENRYIAADKATPDFRCAPKPTPQPVAPAATGDCAVGYTPCIPPYPPDVDCADVNGPIQVRGSDPHGLDRDGDGVACE